MGAPKIGLQIWSALNIEDGVLIGSNATFAYYKFLVSNITDYPKLKTLGETRESVEANLSIQPSIRIGLNLLV